MKMLKNLIYALAAAVLVTCCVPGAWAIPFSFTTNYDILTITATVQTNAETVPKPFDEVYTVRTFTLNNASFLDLFESPDWHDAPFPPGSKLVVSWDAGENVFEGKAGDILVVDKTGTNVLYDASETTWSESLKAYMTVNFYDGTGGAFNANEDNNFPGHYDFTLFSNTSFVLSDGTGFFLSTTGPSKEISTQAWNKNDPIDFTTWSDSERADTYGIGTNVVFGNLLNVTATIKITASGHGRGVGGYYYFYHL
jgi:hypothetical protein